VLESDLRFYRRRANEEMAAAQRAVTAAARERRMQLAGLFLDRLKALETHSAFDWVLDEPGERV
jgi:Holliday junction resolvase-like predicted endonuclease